MKMTDIKQVETPYMRARQEYDDLIGNAVVRASNWRTACYISLFSLIISITGLIIVSNNNKIIPYVIEVTDTGKVKLTGKAENNQYNPGKAVIHYFLSDYVKNICSVPMDKVLLRNNILKAYNFVTNNGKNILNAYMKEKKPFEKNNYASMVEISHILEIKKGSYQVQWTEKSFQDNILSCQVVYVGIFSIQIIQPETEKEIKINPLGLYIDFFSISKHVEG